MSLTFKRNWRSSETLAGSTRLFLFNLTTPYFAFSKLTHSKKTPSFPNLMHLKLFFALNLSLPVNVKELDKAFVAYANLRTKIMKFCNYLSSSLTKLYLLRMYFIHFSCHDSRIHACLYFITPNGHGLKSIDLVCMKKLDTKVSCNQFNRQMLFNRYIFGNVDY